MAEKSSKLLIRNMVCQRCIMTVQNILDGQRLPYKKISMGEVEMERPISAEEAGELNKELTKVGFELIESRIHKIIEEIRKAVRDYLALGMDSQNIRLSSFITKKLPFDYSYLSDLFSSVEGKTIEQYFILVRIEKVKELLVYDHLSLTEISYETGFSSVHHLSAQFKKVTGLTPSHFKKIGTEKRKSLDQP